MQTCNTCGETKELIEFDFIKAYNRHSYQCKACRRAYSKAWRDKNPEKTKAYYNNSYENNKETIKAKTREYQKNNKDKVAKWSKKHRQKNLERCRAYSRKYNKENRSRLREYNAQWRDNNRDKYNNRERHRRAMLRGLPGYHTELDIEEIYIEQLGKCVYCKCSLREAYSVDHIIPVTREGSSDYAYNIQLLCKSCNSSKNNKNHEEYLEYLATKENYSNGV